jgi:hypothetical protein
MSCLSNSEHFIGRNILFNILNIYCECKEENNINGLPYKTYAIALSTLFVTHYTGYKYTVYKVFGKNMIITKNVCIDRNGKNINYTSIKVLMLPQHDFDNVPYSRLLYNIKMWKDEMTFDKAIAII